MSKPAHAFVAPKPGDIVWCRFPKEKGLQPGPKPRPALVLEVGTIADEVAVTVVYGTSQKIDRLFSGEFAITPSDGAAYAASGLSYPTKFNLRQRVELPYTDRWFDVPPGKPFGQQPKLGILHPSLMRRAEAAFRAVTSTGRK